MLPNPIVMWYMTSDRTQAAIWIVKNFEHSRTRRMFDRQTICLDNRRYVNFYRIEERFKKQPLHNVVQRRKEDVPIDLFGQ